MIPKNIDVIELIEWRIVNFNRNIIKNKNRIHICELKWQLIMQIKKFSIVFVLHLQSLPSFNFFNYIILERFFVYIYEIYFENNI